LKYDLLIIGCGKIGECLIQGLLRKKNFLFKKIKRINVLEKNKKRCKFLKKKYSNKITFIDNNEIRVSKKNFHFIFLSIKPKDLNKNIRNYQKFFNTETIMYSLLAGKKLSDINSFFPNIKNIFRVMLNTPICLNEGTIIYKNLRNKFSKTDLFLLNLLGDTYYIKDEKFFNILTAVIGSGPAFFYFLVEALEKKTISSGLQKNLVEKLIKKTFKGTSELLNYSFDNAESLRKKVTSKGGTTEAAIRSLEKNNFKRLISNSVNQAIKISKKL